MLGYPEIHEIRSYTDGKLPYNTFEISEPVRGRQATAATPNGTMLLWVTAEALDQSSYFTWRLAVSQRCGTIRADLPGRL